MYSCVIFFLAYIVASVSAFVPHHPSVLGSRIVGGVDALNGSAPYQASLRFWNSHFCGAIIINEDCLLTAAHCVVGWRAASITAVVGTNTLNAGGDSYGIRSMTHHPQYNNRLYFNDISILRTALKINLGDLVQPISLPTRYTKKGTILELTGWGSTGVGEQPPNNLQFIQLRAISTKECRRRHAHPVIASQICTLTVAGEGACHGDSGSPLVENGRVVGIVSWGTPCAVGRPDVFTRVHRFLHWIQEHTSQQ